MRRARNSGQYIVPSAVTLFQRYAVTEIFRGRRERMTIIITVEKIQKMFPKKKNIHFLKKQYLFISAFDVIFLYCSE